MPYLKRHLTQTILRAAATFPAVLITGARQTGKTTLLRREFGASHRYLSLERPDIRARAQADPIAFLAEAAPPAILDEIQYAPDLLHYIKEDIDANRFPGRWLLTGSQHFALMHGLSQTLSGRVAVLTLDPLSTAEVEQQPAPSGVDALLDEVFGGPAADQPSRSIELADWLLRGGFPEPRLNPQVDRQLWFGSYVQTYLERDVRDLAQIADLGAFTRFLMLVGARTGTALNMSELSREVGVSNSTIKRWLSVLETSRSFICCDPITATWANACAKAPSST